MTTRRNVLWCLATASLVRIGGSTLRAQNVDRPTDEVGPRFFIYREGPVDDYPPAMHMPDGTAIAQNTRATENPESGRFCYSGRYQIERRNFTAVGFNLDGLDPPDRNFNMFEKLDAKIGDRIVVRFWARSPDAARAKFKAGGGNGDSFEFAVETEWLELGPAWRQYELDVTKQDLSALRFAFVWVMDRAHNDIKERPNRQYATLLLDDIYYTRLAIAAQPKSSDK